MDEIAEAAGRIAIADGLTHVTAKRVADAVGVYPGLVNHYFRSADDLVAAAFAAATTARRAHQAAVIVPGAHSATDELKAFLRYATAPDQDPAALLWLDAWRESPRRPTLQREVVRQMETDVTELTELLTRGATDGEFTVDAPQASALRILAMIDGTFAQAAVRTALAGTGLLDYPTVTAMLFRVAERELGLAAGALD